MSKISVIARIPCQEGKRDDVIAAFGEYFPHLDDEAGTLVYEVSADSGDETTVWVYELYADGAALEAHGGSDAFKELGGTLGGLLAGAPELHFCTPVRAKGHEL